MPEEYWYLDRVAQALVGAFMTAFVHERTGRDVTLGGFIGLALGATAGIVGLVGLWVSLLMQPGWLTGRIFGPRQRWYTWWKWW